jgi:dethiobiotin synthetase
MSTLFITATGTNVGKTYTSLQLIENLASQGVKVGAFKPIETGVEGLPSDASQLLQAVSKTNPNFEGFSPYEITAYTFPLPAAPFCADTNQEIDVEVIVQKYHALKALCDVLIVEGAGGLMVPITKDFLMIDLIKKLEIEVLLVTPSYLGCINETLLSIEALQRENIPFDWCVNVYEDKESFREVTQPFYDAVFPQWWSVKEGIEIYTKASV